MPSEKSKTPKRLRQSIKKDPVQAEDVRQFNLPYACEDCTHFCSKIGECTLGYDSRPHRKAQQNSDFLLSGKMALCRFLEID